MGYDEKKGLEDVHFTINMTPRQHAAFLARLATDDELRERLESDPARVLAENGIHVRPQDLPERITLPSKEELQQHTGSDQLIFLAFL